ncbi:MAG TPA: trypsin-like peptidase domain-containing protein [Nitriliruptorales bacterium]
MSLPQQPSTTAWPPDDGTSPADVMGPTAASPPPSGAEPVSAEPARQGPAWMTVLVAAVVAAITAFAVSTLADGGADPATSDAGDTPTIQTSSGDANDPGSEVGTTMSPAEVAESVGPSVAKVEVTIVTTDPLGRSAESTGSGSAVILSSDGWLLTNNHVVENAERVTVTLAAGTAHDATVVGTDPTSDLAVLKIEATGLPAATFADELPQVGETAIAIGSPFGLDGSVTAGIVSALDRTLSSNAGTLTGLIQTDAAINPGNSGGALVDDQGRIIGINTAIYSESGANDGVGFAVPATTATAVAEQLMQGGAVTWPVLGIRGQDVDETLAEAYDLSADSGALVAEITAGSGAEAAGLEPGDIIVEINGEAITSMSELAADIRSREVGDTLVLTILRGAERLTIEVTLGSS